MLSCSFLALLSSSGRSVQVRFLNVVDSKRASLKRTNLNSLRGYSSITPKGQAWLMLSVRSSLWFYSCLHLCPCSPASGEADTPVTQANVVGVFLLDCSACNLDSTSSTQLMSLHHFNGVFLGCRFDFLGVAVRASLQTRTLDGCTRRFPSRAPCEPKLPGTGSAIPPLPLHTGQHTPLLLSFSCISAWIEAVTALHEIFKVFIVIAVPRRCLQGSGRICSARAKPNAFAHQVLLL